MANAVAAELDLATDQLALGDGHDERVDARVSERAIDHGLECRGVIDGVVGNQETARHQSGNDRVVTGAVDLLFGVEEAERDVTELIHEGEEVPLDETNDVCLLYTSPSPRDRTRSRM